MAGARVRNDAVWRETATRWYKYLRFRHCDRRVEVKLRRNKAWKMEEEKGKGECDKARRAEKEDPREERDGVCARGFFYL